jgi:molybdate transport system substrate-binding protein
MALKKYLAIFMIILTAAGFTGCRDFHRSTKKAWDDAKTTGELVVAAAASLTDVMEEIKVLYMKENPDVKVRFTFGASGTLMTQIVEGAPVDIFIPASKKQMDILEEKGLIKTDTRVDLLSNRIVLITPASSSKEINGFEDIAAQKVEKIALGDPASVPVGRYSIEILTSIGIIEEAEDKAVYASDVRQILSWVETEMADCGIVYRTDAMVSDKITVSAMAPEDSHSPVVYPAAVINGSDNVEEAKNFMKFLSTEEARTIFGRYGFGD